jgi:hypothetical protein
VSGPVQDLQELLDRLKTDRPGALTGDQAHALAYLDSRLKDLTQTERSAVLRCASIHLLFVEEEDLQHPEKLLSCSDVLLATAPL